MPDTIKISELNEALALADAAEFPYTQENGGENTTFKAPLTQIAAKIVEDMSYAGINLPVGAGVKSVENTLNYLLGAVGGNPNENIATEYDPTETYAKGDVVIYENVLYICTAPTTGTFDPSKWTATTIDNIIGDLSTLTTTDKSSLVGAVNEVNKKESETLTYSSGGNTARFKFSRFGNMVCVGGSGGAMPMPTSWTNLTGTLSAKFRPTTAFSLALITGDNHLIFLEINTNGTVRVYSNYSGNLYPSGTGIYVTT